MMESIELLREELSKLNIQHTHYADIQPLQPQLEAVLQNPKLCVSLLDPLLKILPSNDSRVKDVVYSALASICPLVPNSEYLMVNQLKKDCKDPNPAVRSSAVMFITCSKVLTDIGISTLQAAFKDCSPHVRRSIVTACRNIHSHSPEILVDGDFLHSLYTTVADSDPVVVANSVQTLDIVLSNEGGIVITKTMCIHLLKMLDSFPIEHRIIVLNVLRRAKPPGEQDEPLAQFLEKYITSSDRNIVLASVQLAIHLSQNQPNKHLYYYEMGLHSLLMITDFAPAEWICQLILFLRTVDSQWLIPFQCKINKFYPIKTEDDIIIKQKMAFLPQLLNEENASECAKQVSRCSKKHSVLSTGIECLYLMAQCKSVALPFCVEKLFLLLKTSPQTQMHQIFLSLKHLRTFGFVTQDFTSVIQHVLEFFQPQYVRDDVNSLLIWMIGQYGYMSDTSLYNMRYFVKNYTNYEYETRTAILEASIKLFSHSEAEYEYILRRILQECEEDQLYISTRAKLYKELLISNPKQLKDIILASAEESAPPIFKVS